MRVRAGRRGSGGCARSSASWLGPAVKVCWFGSARCGGRRISGGTRRWPSSRGAATRKGARVRPASSGRAVGVSCWPPAGSAVGLGNMWRFSYLAAEKGGAGFVALYLFFTVLIGLPVMLAELTIGRGARRGPISALAHYGGPAWRALGVVFVAAGFLILSYYGVIGGWTSPLQRRGGPAGLPLRPASISATSPRAGTASRRSSSSWRSRSRSSPAASAAASNGSPASRCPGSSS
ncbi:MAG: hypothetical protein R3E53_20950 [Myxococcota bacterium]